MFLSRGSHHTFFLTSTEAVMVVMSKAPEAGPGPRPKAVTEKQQIVTKAVLRMRFVGADTRPRVSGLVELPSKANYFIGNDSAKWRTNVPTYAQVEYKDLYPGIDLRYYGNQRQLEHDFIVRPGADPKSIALELSGADTVEIDLQGDLVLHTAAGVIRQRKPSIYQEVNGVRTQIAGAYVIRNKHDVGFEVAAYERTRPLVIDPVLFYSTYLGGSGDDFEDSSGPIVVDVSGNAYVTGITASTDFPVTSGAFQTGFGGGSSDAFVTKLNPTGSGLVYSTYLGGNGNTGDDAGHAIAVDAVGNAYVTGETNSTNFPTTPGAFQTTFGGGLIDGFVTKLNPTGSGLVYSTYLGGSGTELGLGAAVDVAGNAFITGQTSSPDFPTTSGAFQTAFAGGCGAVAGGPTDAFVTKLNVTGSGLVYSTYLGGSCDDFGEAVALDVGGNAFVTGRTSPSNFPVTSGAFQTGFGGGSSDAFVTKLNSNGSALLYSTYLGGNGGDDGLRIVLDSSDNAFVTGVTSSTNFPTTPGVFQSISGGGNDAFVTKLSLLGNALVYSTYLGGSGDDDGIDIAVDVSGNAYVTGETNSTNFPTLNAVQSAIGGGYDAFVTKVNPLGAGLVYSTYLGGSASDGGFGIALDLLPNPNAYVTGRTSSTNFPTTSGAFQVMFGGGSRDAFVTKIANFVLPPPPTVGKVSGGGSITVPNGIGTFGFIVQRQAVDGSMQGDLQYVNHASGAKIHSVLFDAFVIAANTATFGGACTNNGVPCTFTVNVTDNGEPGTNDTFTISVNGGPTDGGMLRGGNIQVHQ